jgi:multidrug resistance efflux pump
VKKGELLAELADDAERADVAQAQAGAAAAAARLAELREGARPEELDQARRDAEAALARAADAREKFAQAQALLQAGATSRTQALEAQRAAEAEEARARSADSRLKLVERGTRQTSLATATAELARARALRSQAEARLALKRLLAPFDATVLEVRTHAGEASGIEVPPPLVVADLVHLEVTVDVPEAKATLVRVGQPAAITVEALSGTAFTGHVASVGLEADRQKGTLEVTVAFDEGSPLEQVRPRMAARVAIDVKRP